MVGDDAALAKTRLAGTMSTLGAHVASDITKRFFLNMMSSPCAENIRSDTRRTLFK
jgi:hypothetical protein